MPLGHILLPLPDSAAILMAVSPLQTWISWGRTGMIDEMKLTVIMYTVEPACESEGAVVKPAGRTMLGTPCECDERLT
jgi:hypothetical protein